MTWLWIKVQCTKHITQKAQSISWISTLLQFIHSDRQTAPTTDYSCSKQCVALHTRYSITHNLHTNIISTHRSSTCAALEVTGLESFRKEMLTFDECRPRFSFTEHPVTDGSLLRKWAVNVDA